MEPRSAVATPPPRYYDGSPYERGYEAGYRHVDGDALPTKPDDIHGVRGVTRWHKGLREGLGAGQRFREILALKARKAIEDEVETLRDLLRHQKHDRKYVGRGDDW